VSSDGICVPRGRFRERFSLPPPRDSKYLIVCRDLLVLCCYGKCVMHEGSVQFTYLRLCILCYAGCAGDAYVLVLAGDR
jgi:hypothetical protein